MSLRVTRIRCTNYITETTSTFDKLKSWLVMTYCFWKAVLPCPFFFTSVPRLCHASTLAWPKSGASCSPQYTPKSQVNRRKKSTRALLTERGEERSFISFCNWTCPQKLQQDRTNIEKHRWHFQRFLFCTAHQVQQVVTSSNKVSATLIRLIKNAHLGQGFWKRQEQPQGGVAHWDAMNVTWSVLIWAIVSLPFIAFYSYIM